MAMKICKDCGSGISKSAKVCPICGRKQKQYIGLILILIIIITIIGIYAVLNEDTTNVDNSTVSSTSIFQSTITRENYNKINNGMTEADVQNILGKEQSISESETPGIGKMILKHYQEPLSLKAIDIYFLDGTVYMKNWTEL